MTSDRKDPHRASDIGEASAPNSRPKRPVDVDALRRLTAAVPTQTENASDLVRRMRDEDRY
jgi:hypothetical protein